MANQGFLFDISSDDKMWLEPCSVDKIVSLLKDPYRWLDEVNEANRTRFGENYVTRVLADYFMISVSLVPKLPPNPSPESSEEPPKVAEDDYLVEGINGTSVLTIRPKKSVGLATIHSAWEDHWLEWESDRHPLLVQKSVEHGLGYGHLELTKKGDSPELRAEKIAAFLLLAADPRHTYPNDETGTPYLNRIHRKPGHMKSRDGDEAKSTGESHFATLGASEVSRINFIYTGRKTDLQPSIKKPKITQLKDLDDESEGDTACNNQIGVLDGNRITTTDVIVKTYA